MGLSLSVLSALLLVLPGAVFFFGLSRLHRSSKPTSGLDQHVSVALVIAIIAAAGAHTIAYMLLIVLHAYSDVPAPDIQSALVFLGGSLDSAEGRRAMRSVAEFPVHVFAYFFFVTLGAAYVGRRANRVFRRAKNADYYELLHPGGVTLIFLTVDLKVGGNCYLYTGIVKEFNIAADGSLSRVVLLGAHRKPMPCSRSGTPSANSWTEIPGEFCVLQLENCCTVNVDYWYTDEDFKDGIEINGGEF